MPRRKHTMTKAELKREVKRRAAWAHRLADAVKHVAPKPHQTQATGKTPHPQLTTNVPRRAAPEHSSKPCRNYDLIAMREICCFQKSVDLLIPLLPFQGLVREIAQDFWMDLHFQSSTILALQEAAEMFLVQLFESANLCTIHHGCQTIAPKDFQLVKLIHHITGINMWWK